MNKKYCLISISLSITIFVFSMVILFIKSNVYATITSIFIPILFGILINYDIKQKEIYKLYYHPLYYYIKTYYDILSQPYERLPMRKKHDMMSSISQDLINFLNDNIKYVSEELSDKLEIIFFYKYENEKVQNEFQDVYNINMLIPIITKELLENYNALHINHYLKRKKYINKKYHEVNGIVYLYVDSFLIDIARKKQYVTSLYECVEFYLKLDKYRDKHYKNYYKIYKFIKKNRNKEINLLIEELNKKFDIKIKKTRDKK